MLVETSKEKPRTPTQPAGSGILEALINPVIVLTDIAVAVVAAVSLKLARAEKWSSSIGLDRGPHETL